MRRVSTMLATALLLIAGGCGLNSYEARLDKTLEKMRYEERLNKMLSPALTKGGWEEQLVYLRPPKGMVPATDFLLTAPEPGKFEIAASFHEEQKQILHVLVRVKRAKATGKKKAAPTPADTADRTNFNRDIISLLTTSFSPPDEITATKFKTVKEKDNEFKEFLFSVNDKDVKVCLNKEDNYETALIFEYPKAEQANVTSKITLCLESFATGKKANSAFKGTGGEEESGAAAPTGPAF
jgi:hypothetical protein